MTSGPQSFHGKANKMDRLPLNPTEAGILCLKAFNLGKRDQKREAGATEISVLIHQAYPNNREQSVQPSMPVFRILYSSNSDIFVF